MTKNTNVRNKQLKGSKLNDLINQLDQTKSNNRQKIVWSKFMRFIIVFSLCFNRKYTK